MMRRWISCLGKEKLTIQQLHQSSVTKQGIPETPPPPPPPPPQSQSLFTQCLLKTTVLGLNHQRYYCFGFYVQTIIYYTPNPSIRSIELILVFTPSTTANIRPSRDQTFLTPNLFLAFDSMATRLLVRFSTIVICVPFSFLLAWNTLCLVL